MKQLHFLRNLGQLRFSGEWVRTSADRHWNFHLLQGRILYATGGEHPVRRWCKNLAVHCPQKAARPEAWALDLAQLDAEHLAIGWEYALLNLWVSRQEMTIEQAAKVVLANVVDILFELFQSGSATDQVRQRSSFSTQLRLIRLEEATARAQVRWRDWQDSSLTPYSPNRAPIIRQPDLLRKQISPQFYQTLVGLLNGQQTLQALALQMRRDLKEVALSLLPFLQLGWVELVPVADLPAPIQPRLALPAKTAAQPTQLVACVDDSFLVRHMMEKLLTSAGYQFLGIDDGLRSIGILIARKPDLIFLDLMMPNANGHEICEQLRKLSGFRHTPIVILTGSGSYANRLRSNFVGASDFLSKPLDAEAVLSAIRKHLEPQGATLPLSPSRFPVI